MFIRLTTLNRDPTSRRPQGIIHAAFDLLSDIDTTRAEWQELRDQLDWFNEHLPVPTDRDTKYMSRRAVFWFRASSQKYIKRAFELGQTLRSHGCEIEVLKSTSPGSIVYSDAFQVATVFRGY